MKYIVLLSDGSRWTVEAASSNDAVAYAERQSAYTGSFAKAVKWWTT